jgi:hypothetical protein
MSRSNSEGMGDQFAVQILRHVLDEGYSDTND